MNIEILSVRDLRNAIAAAKLFMSDDTSRASLDGVHFLCGDDCLIVAASDGHRVIRIELPAPQAAPKKAAVYGLASADVAAVLKALPSKLSYDTTPAWVEAEAVQKGMPASLRVAWEPDKKDAALGPQAVDIGVTLESAPLSWRTLSYLEGDPKARVASAVAPALDPDYVAKAFAAADKLLGKRASVFLHPVKSWRDPVLVSSVAADPSIPSLVMAVMPMRPPHA